MSLFYGSTPGDWMENQEPRSAESVETRLDDERSRQTPDLPGPAQDCLENAIGGRLRSASADPLSSIRDVFKADESSRQDEENDGGVSVRTVQRFLKLAHSVAAVILTDELADRLTEAAVYKFSAGLGRTGDAYGTMLRLDVHIAANQPPLKVCGEIVDRVLYVGLDGVTGQPDDDEPEDAPF